MSKPKEYDAAFLDEYRIYRARLEHEDNLINHRMTWLLLSQVILLVTFVNLEEAQQLSRLGLVIKLVGFSVTFFSWFGIILAIISTYALRRGFWERWQTAESFFDMQAIRPFYWVGHITGFCLPLMFVGVWLTWLFVGGTAGLDALVLP